MALFGSGPDAIVKELRKLQGKRVELAKRLVDVRAEIASFHGTSADEILATYLDSSEGAESGAAKRSQERRRIAELECEAQDLVAAEAALVRRISKAIVDLAKARAELVRSDAKKLERELQKHNAETQRLLLLVEAHEGGGLRFVPDYTPAADHRIFDKSAHEVAFGKVELPTPRSWQMQVRIEQLNAEADHVEARGQANAGSGSVQGSSLQDLLVFTRDVERLAPTEAEILEWLADVDVRATIAWERQLSDIPRVNHNTGQDLPEPEHGIRYSLAWDVTGHIDRGQSTAVNELKFTPRPVKPVVTI